MRCSGLLRAKSRMIRIIKNCIKTTESVIQLVSHVNCPHCPHLTDRAAQSLLARQADVDPLLGAVQVGVLAAVRPVGLDGVRQLVVLLLLGWSDPPPGDWLTPVQSDWDEAAAPDLQLQPAPAEDESHGLSMCGRLHWEPTDLQQLVSWLQTLQTHRAISLPLPAPPIPECGPRSPPPPH